MATVTIEIDIDGDGNTTISPNPASVGEDIPASLAEALLALVLAI